MKSFVFILTLASCLHAQELTLEAQCAHPIADNAVFQQKMPLPVWGKSLPNAKVEVEFDKQKKSTVAAADGSWKVMLDPLTADPLTSVNEAPVGRSLTITTSHEGKQATKIFSNILIGEVWLCSGQSNMAGPFGRASYPPGSGKEANFPALRYYNKGWTVCTPETVGKYSRVAVSFARELQAKIKVPVGIIYAAQGGTQIESWIAKTPGPDVPVSKYECYLDHVLPIVGYGMRGTLWYQGEGNQKDGKDYFPKMKQLIEGWRKVWGQGEFPFYFVQISSIGESPTDNPACGDGRAAIRQAQFESLSIPNTGMVVTIDIGDKKEHPANKHDIGLRLARWALHREYGQKDLVPSGPLYKSQKIEGSSIRVSFDYAQNGLMLAKKEGYEPPVATPDAAIPWLSIQAKDGTWHWAEGKIDGSDLIVSNKDVKEPIGVRYAYTSFPVGFNLYNKDGLPASPFTTIGY
ncbi:MAG: sialate O-acetylesterase [Verrucomicrobiota bacterium]